jgi:hypothetical protein
MRRPSRPLLIQTALENHNNYLLLQPLVCVYQYHAVEELQEGENLIVPMLSIVAAAVCHLLKNRSSRLVAVVNVNLL